MMRKQLNLFLIILLTCFIYACNSGNGGNNSNPQQIAAIQSIADNYITQNKNESGLSGVSVTAQCNSMNYGQPITVFSGTIGHGAENQRPIQNNDLWQIGSNTKSFASIVLVQLASDPKYNFSLDDHIQKWITPNNYPELQNLLRYNPTIRQMMNMTSGIPDDGNVLNESFIANPYTYISPLSLISYANVESTIEPGTQWNYSNTNYNIFDILVPLITKNSLQTEINNRIIKPLGLQNTYFVTNLPTDYANASRLLKGYIQVTGKPLHETSKWTLSWANGSGNIISTTSNINTYYRNLFTTNKLLNFEQLSTLSSFVSTVTGLPVDTPSLSQSGNAYGLGIGAINFAKVDSYQKEKGRNFIPIADTNLIANMNNYDFVYWYSGGTLGYVFIYFYNPANSSSVVVSYNNNIEQSYDLPLSVLNYMDPICH